MDQDQIGQAGYLRQTLERLIVTYRGKQVWNKAVTGTMRAAIITAGGLTTVLLGVKNYASTDLEHLLSIAALVISAITTGLTAWEGFAEHAQRWIRARITLGALYEIRDELDYATKTDDPPPKPVVDGLFGRMMAALHADNEHWATRRVTAINGSVRQQA